MFTVGQPTPLPVQQPYVHPQFAPAQPGQAGGFPQPNIPMEALMDFLKEEAVVDVDAALKNCKWVHGGPSEGGISSHVYEPFTICRRRAYLAHVLGLVKKARVPYYEFGSLFHAVMEAHRRSGGQATYEPCQLVTDAGGGALAGDVWALASVFLHKYAPQEAQLWSFRALEENAVVWLPEEKINGKRVRIPVSARQDAIVYRKSSPDEPHPPAGPLPGGVWIEDLKTAMRNDASLTKGFGMSTQFLIYQFVYLNSDLLDRFGPLSGVIVSIAFKHKQPTPDKSVVRLDVPLAMDAMNNFYYEDFKPKLVEYYGLLARDDRKDERLWPCNRSMGCSGGKYGLCPYFDLCDLGNGSLSAVEGLMESEFEVNPRNIVDVKALWTPPKDVKARKGIAVEPRDEDQAEATVKAASSANKRSKKAGVAQYALDLMVETLKAQRVNPNTDELLFHPSKFLVPNHTEVSVKAKLDEMIGGLLAPPNTFMLNGKPDVQYVCTDKGCTWLVGAEGEKTMKGSLTRKKLVDALCKDWWNVTTMAPLPPGQQEAPTEDVQDEYVG